MHFEAFRDDSREAVKRALKEGVWMIQVGTQKDTSGQAVALAESFPEGVYATVGLHPIHTDKSFHDAKELGVGGKDFVSRGEIFDYDYYRTLAKHEKVVAIGECGLDYFRITNKELGITKQKEIFKKQIELALEVGKPLMLHCRPSLGTQDAYDDMIEILNSYLLIHNSRLRGNVHFFAGSWETAKKFLEMGFTLSFTGVITFTHDYDEVIKNAPLDMIMSETDSPYVAPVPYRGKRNESLYVQEVVKRIAEVRGEDFDRVRNILVSNAKKMFAF